MADYKKQHTVQRAYLQLWKKEDAFFIYDLQKNQTHPAEPKSIFRENYIYNWDKFEGNEKFIIEELMKDIEDNGLPKLLKLATGSISKDEKYLSARYIAIQSLRTPRILDQMHSLYVQIFKDSLIETLKDPKKKADLLQSVPSEDNEILEKLAENPGTNVNELFEKFNISIKNIREIWLQTILKLHEELTQLYFESPWYILEAGKKRMFVTSDNPVVTMTAVPTDNSPQHKDIACTEITFPLDPQRILLIRRYHGRKHNIICRINDIEGVDGVRELNWRTTAFADRYIASSSSELIKKCAKIAKEDWQHIHQDKPRVEAQSKRQLYIVKPLRRPIFREFLQ